MADRPLLFVGIAGGTASGKTTLARNLAEVMPSCLLISHDRYYHTVPDPAHHNYDEPSALDSRLLTYHLREMQAGRAVIIPRYNFTRHAREPAGEMVTPAPLVIVEGILVLSDPVLAPHLALRVFVSAPDDIRLIRRIRRDVVERGRSVEEVLHRYETTVRPSHERLVAPVAAQADLVLDGTAPITEEVRKLRDFLVARAPHLGAPEA